jgi:hypothetical protein
MSDTANSSRIFSPLRMRPADRVLGSLMEKYSHSEYIQCNITVALRNWVTRRIFKKIDKWADLDL